MRRPGWLNATPTGVFAGKGEPFRLKPGDLPVRSRYKSSREDCGAERIAPVRSLVSATPGAPVPSRYSSPDGIFLFVDVARLITILAASILWTLGALRNQAVAQVAGELRGRITDVATARPIADARVEVADRSEAVRSGADGAFVVRGLAPGSYAVTVRALGYAAFTHDFEIKNGRATLMDAALVARVVTLSAVHTRAVRDTLALGTTVFDRTAIEQSGRRDLAELLQTAPGVVITQSGGAGQSSQVSIRSSSANQVLVLLDGVPLNSSISGSADLSRVSLESVDKVTVRTGAQSARYGPRAMAGVIEVETRKPRHEMSTLVRTGALGERNASLAVGNSTDIRNAALGAFVGADFRTIEGDFSYRLPALRGGGRATRINSDATSRQWLAGLSIDGAQASASLRGTWQHTQRGLAGTIIQPSSTGKQGNTRVSVGATAQGTARHVAWTLATDVTHEEGTFVDRTPPFGQAFDDTTSAMGITASASATVEPGPATVSGGVELRTLDIASTMLAANAPHRQQLFGAWGTTRLTRQLATQFRVDAELSARLDRNSFKGEPMFSPRGTLRVSGGVLSTSLSLGSGYAPPTLSDQFFHEGVQVRANPNLKPERTRQDLEARITLRESKISLFALSGEAASYRSNIDGMILWFPDFRFIWSPTNYDVKRSGWEVSGKIGAPAAHLQISGTLNRNNVAYTGAILHGQVAYRPRNSANLVVSFALEPLRLDFTHRHIGTRRTIAGTSLNALAPYSMSDARASTSLTFRRWTFNPAVSVENVFNRAAAMLVDYPFPPRTWSISLRVRRSTSPSKTA